MSARKQKIVRPGRFRMERLETRRLMARDMGPNDPDFPIPDDPGGTDPAPDEPPAAVSRLRPQARTEFQLPESFNNPGDTTPQAAPGRDVTAMLQNGVLTLTEANGSFGGSQSIQFTRLSNGKLRIEGYGSTGKINGQSYVDIAMPSRISVNFGGGDDAVRFNPSTPMSFSGVTLDLGDVSGALDRDVAYVDGVSVYGGSLEIRTGAGQDVVYVYNSHANDLKIDSGRSSVPLDGDRDMVLIRGLTTSGSVVISTGAGDDYIQAVQSTIGDGNGVDGLQIFSGMGGDTVDIGYFRDSNGNPVFGPGTTINGYLHAWAHTLENEFENDNDVFRLENLVVYDTIQAFLGSGDDTLSMTGVHSTSFGLSMGAGNDNVRLIDSGATLHAGVYMGEGDDALEVQGLMAGISAYLDGGAGANDSIVRLYDRNIGSLTQAGWEVINGARQQFFHLLGEENDMEFFTGG
jgi:hypothetical protein